MSRWSTPSPKVPGRIAGDLAEEGHVTIDSVDRGSPGSRTST
jgi:hypothetical protein